MVTPTLQTGRPGPPVGPGKAALPEGSLYSWAPHSGSRPVEAGTEARGMEPPPRGGAADLEGVRPGSSGLVCISRDLALSTLVFPHTSSSSGTACYGTIIAKESAGRVLERVHRNRVSLLLALFWPA